MVYMAVLDRSRIMGTSEPSYVLGACKSFFMVLVYHVVTWLSDLALDECVIHNTRDTQGHAWWQLWAWVCRADNGAPFYVAVPVCPNGSYQEAGPSGRRTWGLSRVTETDWQIAPSIDVVGDMRPDGTRGPSLWHETPHIIGVPPSERWVTEAHERP